MWRVMEQDNIENRHEGVEKPLADDMNNVKM